MKQPKGWHGFKSNCEMIDYGQSNMSSSSSQEYCSRKDRQGKDRPRWEGDKHFAELKCSCSVCPKLKKPATTCFNDTYCGGTYKIIRADDGTVLELKEIKEGKKK